MDRATWGLRLLVAGMGLGVALMLFVALFNGFAFYQDAVAPTQTEVMRPLGFVVDGLVVASFAMTLAGIGCFSAGPSEATAAIPSRPPADRRREDRLGSRPRRPASTHGST